MDPGPIAARLVATSEQFEDLRDGNAKILFLMRTGPKIKAGRSILGEMCLPSFGGAMGAVGTWMLAKLCDGVPDFVMILDAEYWLHAGIREREALVFHELLHGMHAQTRDGEPRFSPEGDVIWAIRGHDVEEFDSVVRRFGAWTPDIERFMAAAREGGA